MNLTGWEQLLFVCADGSDGSTPDGVCQNSELVPLFDSAFQSYFWDYDNSGIKNAQIRFYPIQ